MGLLRDFPNSTAENLAENGRRAEPVPLVQYYDRNFESRLYDLEKRGLVSQAPVDAAGFHHPDEPAPVLQRRWEITDAGRATLLETPPPEQGGT